MLVGASLCSLLSENCFLTVWGKAGIYGNDARHQSILRDVNNTVTTRNYSDDHDAAAFLGEIDTRLSLRLTSSAFVRIGYDLLWIEQLALAPEQFQQDAATPDASTRTDGGVFLRGAYAGFRFAW